jgi:RNA 3'-terminal phosphate cyclase
MAEAAREVQAGESVSAAIDTHHDETADQLLVFTALADGRSVYRAPEITDHVESAAWLASLFLGVEVDLGADATITVVGRGRPSG